ncbi:hypothetical protein ABLO16_13320, partial [Mycobacterium tuberculosis]
MSAGPAIEVAVAFVWLGMVVAISFLEAPLKFRAAGVLKRRTKTRKRFTINAKTPCFPFLIEVKHQMEVPNEAIR